MNRKLILIDKAKDMLKYNTSEALIESKLWASRGANTSIKDIKEAIQIAKLIIK